MQNQKEKRPFNKGKKKRSYKKPDSKNQKEEIIDPKREGSNNPRWYGSPELVAAAARINFTNPLGRDIGFRFDNSGTVTISNRSDTVSVIPGIVSFGTTFFPGWTDGGSSAANIFIRNFYSWIRHQNSGHANYDAPDLGMYVFGIDEIHALIEHLIRVYGVARTAAAQNRYIPEGYLKAMGIGDISLLIRNLADFRAHLLALMVKAGTLCMPVEFRFNERHREMYKYIYTETPIIKSQSYLFYPEYMRVYDETAGKLKAEKTPFGQDIYKWLDLLDRMVGAMVDSESMNIMSGDILKAYGADKMYKMQYFADDYTVIPVYNPEILTEIHNLTIAGDEYEDGAFDLWQDTNYGIIKSTPYFKTSTPAASICPVIDMPVEVPTPDEIMIATRLAMVGPSQWVTDHYKFTPSTMGSEAVNVAHLLRMNVDGTYVDYSINSNGLESQNAMLNEVILTWLSNFDWRFGMYILDYVDDNTFFMKGINSELANYTVVDSSDLSKINEIALISELNVPLLGTWTI